MAKKDTVTQSRDNNKKWRLHGGKTSQKGTGKWHKKGDGHTKWIQAPQSTATAVTDYRKGDIYKHSKKIHENVITRGAMGTQKLIQVETQAQRATKYSN